MPRTKNPNAPKLSRGGKQKLLAAVQHIVDHPRTFDMNEWCYTKTGCGTTACLAGRIVLNEAIQINGVGLIDAQAVPARYKADAQSFSNTATLIVGATPYEDGWVIGYDTAEDLPLGIVERLYYVRFWPEEFKARFHKVSTNKAKALILQDRVNHWLATGE